MSWSLSKTGRAGKLSEVVASMFEAAGGAPKDSAEEAAKNAIGGVAEILCKSLPVDKVVTISAHGSAWNADGNALSQALKFEFSTNGEFIE